MNKIKLVVFDLWNTLAHTTGGFRGTRKMFEKAGVDMPYREFVKAFEKSVQLDFWEKREDAYVNLCRNVGIEPSEKNVRMLIDIRDRADGRVAAFDFSIPMLRRLKADGYATGLLSNSSVFGAEKARRDTGIFRHIDHFVFPFHAEAIKPDPAIFERMLQVSGCRASEALMIGDNMEDDVIPARKLGMKAVHFTDYAQLKEDLREFRIKIP